MTEPTAERKRLPKWESAISAEGKETYHVEDGQTPCWCGLNRDHTNAEFWAWLETAPE